ncbi:MFS transporter [Sphingomonas sp. RS2018]
MTAPTRPAPTAGYAWYSVGVLTICYTLAFIDRQILGLMIGPIKAEFAISDTQVGLLGGFAFSLFYSVVSLPLGRLVDRVGRWKIIGLGVLFWSLMTMTCAVARGYPGLFLARMGVGVGEATLAPAAVSAISDSFPNERLGSAMSVYGIGIYLGSGLALLLGGAVVASLAQTPVVTLPVFGDVASWRVIFLIVGLPGIFVGLWVLTLREPPRRNAILGRDGAVARLSMRQAVAEIGSRRGAVAGIAIGLMFQAIALYAYMLWSPEMLRRVFGWSAQTTGLTMGVIVLVGGTAGMLTGGRLSDRGLRAGRRDAALGVATVSSIAGFVVFATLLLALGSATGSVAILFVGVFLLAMPAGSCYAAAQMVLPNQVRGQAMALILLIANFGGLTLGPLLPGVLNDYVFESEDALGLSLGATLALTTLAAAFVFNAARPAYRRHHLALNP